MKIKKVLIANRGEIAFRISKTLRKMKIKSVGLCIPGEREASFLSLCDSVLVFSQDHLESYLRIDEIIELAQKAGADAIHPGYGFLSENAQFAEACEKNGIKFIGPSSTSIELMGNKQQAKDFAKTCGMPVLETIAETSESDSDFERKVKNLRLPIILKPLQGGGGKGMQIVRDFGSLSKSIEEGRNIAKKAFGDSRLLAEPLIENALHIEVQIIGDQQGHVRHLFERDCTIQRRHQKIIEESPTSLIPEAVVKKMFENALTVAEKSQYQNLGTVEFIVDQQHQYYFMEMNTRLQVEHPVTEMITGLDLVEKQIRIAEGESLEKILPKKITRKGHAIEVRVYSENPSQNFMPSTGTIEYLNLPKETKSLRIDCGVEKKSKIHHSFDPMILKITVHGKNRSDSIRTMLKALDQTFILGVQTNINYLTWVLKHQDFIQSKHYTTWSEATLDQFHVPDLDPNELSILLTSFEREKNIRNSDWKKDPWLTLGASMDPIQWKNEKWSWSQNEKTLLSGVAVETPGSFWISWNGDTHSVPKKEKTEGHDEIQSTGNVTAPMTGTIIQVHVREGEQVKKDDLLIEMEAMKMQYKIEALRDGTIKKILCQTKDIVEQESVLIEM